MRGRCLALDRLRGIRALLMALLQRLFTLQQLGRMKLQTQYLSSTLRIQYV